MSPSLWVLIEKFSQQVVWLVLFAILAPILGPKPYGLYAIVMVFIGFCEFVTVEAAAEALMGMDPLEPLHLRTATTCNLAVAVFAGLVVFLVAPWLGQFFGEAELTPIFRALSILPALSALTSAPVAVLKRQLHFRPLAIRSTLGLTIGGAAGVALAISGAGVWSLVAQILIQRLAEVVILWVTAGRNAGAGLSWSRPHYEDLRVYAAHVFVSRSMVFLGGQVPRIIIGYFLGPVDLGLFTLASRFPDTLAQVIISPRAIVARIDLRRFRFDEAGRAPAFYRLVRDIALVGFPVSLGAAATIPLLISVWLDERWQGAILACQLMCLSAAPQVVFYASSAVLMALNFPREEARIAVVQNVTNGLAVLAAVPFGLNAVCLVMVLRLFLLMPYCALTVSRVCGIPTRSITAATGSLFLFAVTMAAAVLALSPALVRTVGDSVALASLVLIGGVIYAGLVAVFTPSEARRLLSRLPFASSVGVKP